MYQFRFHNKFLLQIIISNKKKKDPNLQSLQNFVCT